MFCLMLSERNKMAQEHMQQLFQQFLAANQPLVAEVTPEVPLFVEDDIPEIIVEEAHTSKRKRDESEDDLPDLKKPGTLDDVYNAKLQSILHAKTIAKLTKLWESRQKWFTVKVFEKTFACQQMCDKKGTVGWSLPYEKSDGKSWGRAIKCEYKSKKKWMHSDLKDTVVQEWKVAKGISQALSSKNKKSEKKMSDVRSELFSVCQFLKSDGEKKTKNNTIRMSFHEMTSKLEPMAHCHILLGMNGHVRNTQAYKKTVGMKHFQRSYKEIQSFDFFVAEVVYLLSGLKHKINGVNNKVALPIVKELVKELKDVTMKIEDPYQMVDSEESDVDSDGSESGDDEFAALLGDSSDEGSSSESDCESEVVSTKLFKIARDNKRSWYAQNNAAQLTWFGDNRIFDSTDLHLMAATGDERALSVSLSGIFRLQVFFKLAKIKVIEKGLGRYMKKYYDKVNEDMACSMFQDLPNDWQRSMLAVAILLANPRKKMNAVWLHGTPNIGKTYFFREGLEWLRPYNLCDSIGGNFPLQAFGSPGFYCMLDDCKLAFDDEGHVEMFKNITAGQVQMLNIKYDKFTKSYKQPCIILNNVNELTILHCSNVDKHMQALQTRFYLKHPLYDGVERMEMSQLENMWQWLIILVLKCKELPNESMNDLFVYTQIYDQVSHYFPAQVSC